MSLPVIAARLRMPVFIAGFLLVLASPWHESTWAAWVGAGSMAVSIVTTFIGALAVQRAPIPVQSPVERRWVAINSPAEKVPSHGVHSAGQTYAIDLVHWPDRDRPWKPVHAWPLMRRPEDFPGFGQPVFAPAAGRVDVAHPVVAAGLPFELVGHDMPRDQEALDLSVR